MDASQDAETKFRHLQKKYILLLQAFCRQNATDTKKLEKAKILLNMLQDDYQGYGNTIVNFEKFGIA